MISKNDEKENCDHSHGFYFDQKSIITCAKCFPIKSKRMKKEKGKKIESLDELARVLKEDRSIYVTVWGRATSTAFIYSWSIRMCKQHIEAGWFWTVKK
jgi:hypothetical protein